MRPDAGEIVERISTLIEILIEHALRPRRWHHDLPSSRDIDAAKESLIDLLKEPNPERG